MKKYTLVLCFLMIMILLAIPGSIFAQSTSLSSTFTYQGYLTNASGVVNSQCDFQFGLFDASTAGTQIGSTLTRTNISVINGGFNVQLDFGGAAFNGTDRYLNIEVRCPAGSGSYTPLTPRQSITPTPYAFGLYGLEVQQNATSPNLIGGSSGNTVSAGVVGAFIGGGGNLEHPNRIFGSFGMVGGGESNTTSGYGATVAGGGGNLANGDGATIAGGGSNTASGTNSAVGGGLMNMASGMKATIGGGYANIANIDYTTVSGGFGNTASGDSAVVAGGHNNTASEYSTTVGGGETNTASNVGATVSGGEFNVASGDLTAVGGGMNNAASGDFSTIPGGANNVASRDYSFAAGRRAKAISDGAFVWADSTNADFSSYLPNQFFVRASGGVSFFTDHGATTGAQLASGSGAWSSLSDRNAKANFSAVDPQAVLQGVINLPLSIWNYKTQDSSIRHIGPMAQDFYSSFSVGEDNTHISTIDSEGVALAAIQGLYQVTQDQKTQLQLKDQQIAGLQTRLDDMNARLIALENRTDNSQPQPQNSLPTIGLIGGLVLGGAWLNRRKNAG